ncbi:glycerophosphodiester phosphodiesterase family protein [Spelaeicoccus albus]|uniref:Glycerophosphoryl diester phosphodiesterase n=1 Tax=Spelaeicoccus albus TaxID=1280376 RepID=A0A7Z0D3V7_9MICO|nr:glycerophosphodiester phosphodiesterase family protein [Spelaeicoccus albus]NYI68397.1 glycerophosphoryl diester phosphodiesterase [Spelaeicoccus albus]
MRQFRPTAHRGGAALDANLGIENTVRAFMNARNLGYTYLETDVRTSCDGVPYVLHDAELTRMTGMPGLLSETTSRALDDVLVAGREPLPRLEAVLTELPDCHFNIDLKDDGAPRRVADVLTRTGAASRVTVASFDNRRLRLFRRLMPDVATSASTRETALFVLGTLPRLRRSAVDGGATRLQLPLDYSGLRVVTRRLVERAHLAGLAVDVWTIDDPAVMNELIDLGVDGIVSDAVDVLRDVAAARELWPTGA